MGLSFTSLPNSALCHRQITQMTTSSPITHTPLAWKTARATRTQGWKSFYKENIGDRPRKSVVNANEKGKKGKCPWAKGKEPYRKR